MNQVSRSVAPLFALLTILALAPAPATAQAGSAVPTPESVIGFEPGADYELARFDQVESYFRALAEASDRVRLEQIGTSVQGRPMLLATISSAENLENLDEYREIAARLATDPDLSEEEARSLAERGKSVVWIDGGLHATEVAGAQFPPKFAYRLATEESEEARRIREDVIVLLMPVMNPDGLDIVADWYLEHVGTPFETSGLPTLYHEYVGHDNNRDWFMLTQPESRAVADQLWHRWYPQIVVNHHQTSPFPGRIFIPPFADPVNPNIPAMVTTGINLVGTHMHRRFVEEDKPGAVSRVGFTQWWNGGMRTAPYFHNQIGILTEVALYRYATPRHYEPESLPSNFGSGLAADRPSTWYPLPWKGGWWRLGDAVDYMVTASMAAADIGDERKEAWLYDTHRMAVQATEAGEEGGPFAYVVPLERQGDPMEAVKLLEVLRRGGVEVHRATEGFEAGGESYPAGTYVAFAGQPYRAHLMDLMEPQDYPDRSLYPGGPPATPYDLAGWTLPIQMGIDVDRVDEPFQASVEPVEEKELPPPAGAVEGDGDAYLLSPRTTSSFTAVRALLDEGVRMERTGQELESAGRSWPAGTWVVHARASQLQPHADELGLRFVAADDLTGERHEVNAPRIGLYRSWDASMDEGWTRWVLEQYGLPYTTLRDADVRDGGLADDFDVIVLPDQGARTILQGHLEGTMPERYTGGVGVEGAAALKRFVEDGGTLVTLDDAGEFAIQQFSLPVYDPVDDRDPQNFFVPGSLLRMRVDPADPVGWGMDEESAASFVRSAAFGVVPAASEGDQEVERRVDVFARYASEDPLLSGWENGAGPYLGDRAAALRVPVGRGQVVLFGFRPQFRAQPRDTFKMFFNALFASTMDQLPLATMPETPAEEGGSDEGS